MTYRPRGVFARALYDKVNNDRYIEGYDMKLVSVVVHNDEIDRLTNRFAFFFIEVVQAAE